MNIKLSHLIFAFSFAIFALFTVNFAMYSTSLFQPMMEVFAIPFIGLVLTSFRLNQKLTLPDSFETKNFNQSLLLGTVSFLMIVLATAWNSFVYLGDDFYTSPHFIVGIASPIVLFSLTFGRCVWLKYENDLTDLFQSVSN